MVEIPETDANTLAEQMEHHRASLREARVVAANRYSEERREREDHDGRRSGSMRADEHGTHGAHAGASASHAGHQVERRQQSLPGLASADGGLRLEAEPVVVAGGVEVPFEFRIVREGDGSVTTFDELHERRMHLIVVRRDLTGFQHLHPKMGRDGTWSRELTLPSAGVWRAFADFSTGGVPMTLGIDLFAESDFRPERPSEPTTSFTNAGDLVLLETTPDTARFTVTRDGEPVQVEPYLGARGHLVVLRWGDLAFLHVHPADENDIAFAVSYPSKGMYRLFLQYSVDGDVRTAAFTTSVS